MNWVPVPKFRQGIMYVCRLSCGHSNVDGMHPRVRLYGCGKCDKWVDVETYYAIYPGRTPGYPVLI